MSVQRSFTAVIDTLQPEDGAKLGVTFAKRAGRYHAGTSPEDMQHTLRRALPLGAPVTVTFDVVSLEITDVTLTPAG